MLLLALLLGLSTFAISYNLLSIYIKTEKVVVAGRDLNAYQEISRSDLKVVEIPRKGLHPERVANVEGLVGSYTLSPLIAGQAVLTGHVITSSNRPGISTEISWDERGIFIPAEASHAVGGLINPGDRIDLIWSSRSANSNELRELYGSFTVLKRAKVIKTVNSESGEFKGVVIAAAPEKCEEIAYYLGRGSMYLAVMSWGAAEGGN